MISALISTGSGVAGPPLASDLERIGVHVLGAHESGVLLEHVIKAAPNLVVCYETTPDSAHFEVCAAIYKTSPRPVVMFTTDPDADKIALAMRSGVHAYVVNGYGLNRLRSVIHLAQARFRHEQMLRDELVEVNQRFAERKLVDRAKGILMGARQLREEQAYRALRSAAMSSKQRIGQVAQVVIDQARYGEGVNRAGQLRMLSQRLVKLYALACAGIVPARTAGLLTDSIAHIESNFLILGRSLSKPTFGDLLDTAMASWAQLRAALTMPPRVSALAAADGLAEQFLQHAERLTTNLEFAGGVGALQVVNVAGRQRMLSQRLAKEALLGGSIADGSPSRIAFEDAMAYLHAIPLSNAEIKAELANATHDWEVLKAALTERDSAAGQAAIAEVSETLLGHFDRLTDHYERGMQTLI